MSKTQKHDRSGGGSSPAWLLPTTGHPHPIDGRERAAVTAAAAYDGIIAPHPAHDRMAKAFDTARLCGLASGDGRKMAIASLGPSGSGKTTTIRLLAERTAAGRPPVGGRPADPVKIVPVDNGCTNRRLWASVLEVHDDPPGKGTEETFRERAYATMRRAGTELLVFDEVQHLIRSPNARDVTDSLKRILDDGVVTLGFLGVEQARPLLTRNIQLANRMHPPADIRPLDYRSAADRAAFVGFVGRLDQEIVRLGILPEAAGLASLATSTCLLIVSGGVVGVVVNLVRHALMHAVARDARRIEPYDLSRVTDTWAVATQVCKENPFRKAAPPAATAGRGTDASEVGEGAARRTKEDA